MQIDASPGLVTGFTLGLDPDGRENVVVVIKRTYAFPSAPDRPCTLADVPEGLATADTFWGAPGFSSPRDESDFAPRKPYCDVLVEAVAHAPGGRLARRVPTGLRLGNLSKQIDVVGDRVWQEAGARPTISEATPFNLMPITYDRAFGGVDALDPEDDPPPAYAKNPVGRGWHQPGNRGLLDGQPLPNTEQPGRPVTLPWEHHAPMSYGPLGRGWPERLRHGGTYDQNWIDNVFPFLPADFDPRYHQAAPPDQQMPAPIGGELVELHNLTPEGYTAFPLPSADMPVLFVRARAPDVSTQAMLDTVVIRPAARQFSLTWRASLPLTRDIFEVPSCIVGPRSRSYWRARALGKAYYPSLGALVAQKTAEEVE
ncbi:hypothetical protein C8J27_10869 [Rhodobacter aestuarii]|uniref:DUF2169 domain-containing protein n=1 Tax=Rhodobacter aestuarii TaxID=453582 RepID=A0A1N7PKZ9_9RHOB|nr:DUF2169 domain-containing protein [Rhodobacter aestuarii]PTV94334.1 hypothetical protein C8J27_10869 [Rhodobacter aestuarii]SIT11258.1 hypothetical protein SAMN05421580_11092 [Rhodobacter aestuarii]